MADLIPFDNRDGWIWFDGQMVPWREAKIHVVTHGLHYGSAVFEGEHAYNGKVFKLQEHTERLFFSAKSLELNFNFSVEEINQATRDVIAKNNFTEAYIRPLVWRGSDLMGVGASGARSHVMIAAWVWPSYFNADLRANGIKLVTSEWRRGPANCAPVQAKAAGLYMTGTLSKHMAERKQATDALMLDWRGQVAEASASNIVFIKNGEVHTPIPDCFLNGITRQTIIDLAKARGLKVHERAIWPQEIVEMDEVFVTGTAVEVCAVGQIDDAMFKVGPITQMLRDDFEALVQK
jgi:branched-chain amino acid aminotransferase